MSDVDFEVYRLESIRLFFL